MKLNFEKIQFKNFLSFGNIWNEVFFENGINFIIGENGIGKSSVLMALSFALFGKVQKDVIQKNIINWQNKKKCEVFIYFYKNEDYYIIKRGLAPNYLEIEKNGIVQDKDTDVRTTQKRIEEEILEFGYDIFNNLIFCNMNNTISILSTTAQKKRKFIEDLFSDMEYFSILMEKTKGKIKSIKEKINNNIINISYLNREVENLQKEVNEIETPNIAKEFKEYKELQEKYEELIQDGKPDENEISELEKKLKLKKEEIEKLEKDMNELHNEIYKINADIKVLNSELKNIEKNEKYKQEYKEIEEWLNENKPILEFWETKKEELKGINEEIESYENDKNKLEAHTSSLVEQKEKLYPDYNLKNKTNCPTCGSEINYENVKEHFKIERKEIEDKLKIDNEKIYSINKELKILKENKNNLEEENKNFEELNKTISNKELRLKDLKEYSNVENSYEKINKEISKLEEDKLKIEKQKKDIDDKIHASLLERDDIEFDFNIKSKKVNKIYEINDNLKMKKLSYDHKKERKKEAEERVENKKSKIKDNEKKIEKLEENNSKLNDLYDYFKFLKESLKDENIKSYIINVIIPYLNQKVNEYLTELGFNFYVEFDSWLNIKIIGSNSRNCTLGSLSGGESKSVDLITKFALMNIAKMKAKVYPDILILDEILDSSIDAKHLEKLMEIIKFEQDKDNLKIYIISHRPEINDMSNGKVFSVEKKNDFSYFKEL